MSELDLHVNFIDMYWMDFLMSHILWKILEFFLISDLKREEKQEAMDHQELFVMIILVVLKGMKQHWFNINTFITLKFCCKRKGNDFRQFLLNDVFWDHHCVLIDSKYDFVCFLMFV